MKDQAEQHQKWWQHRVAIRVVAIVLVVVIVLIIIGYWFDWTGFNGYNQVTITRTISGTNAGTVTRTEEYQPGKTLWDWLQLLIVPVVLAIAGFWLNQMQNEREQRAIEERAKREKREAEERAKIEREAEEKRAQTEREIAADNQREAALQAYINNISELLLEKHLGKLTEDGISTSEYEQVREIARVRTLTVLPRLDGMRKRSVLLFLHEAGLLDRGPEGIRVPIINLYDADFSQACLSRAHLFGVSLSKANLSGANLSRTYLRKAKFHRADLRKANLSNKNLSEFFYLDEEPNLWEADLTEADLSGADLREADLSGARYNMNTMLGKNTRGEIVKDKDGEPIMIKATIWPKGFDESKLREREAICVDYEES